MALWLLEGQRGRTHLTTGLSSCIKYSSHLSSEAGLLRSLHWGPIRPCKHKESVCEVLGLRSRRIPEVVGCRIRGLCGRAGPFGFPPHQNNMKAPKVLRLMPDSYIANGTSFLVDLGHYIGLNSCQHRFESCTIAILGLSMGP